MSSGTVGDEGQARPPGGLSERLAAGLLDLIAERGLAPGDNLPTVRALAEKFGVTPPTIREALRRLQATDAVQLRHGSGIFVGPGLRRTLLPNPHSMPLRNEQILQLVEARLTIEPGIAALAAQHRTDDQLARLEITVEIATRPCVPRTGPRNFHRELAGCSGNPMLFDVIDSLLAVRSREQRSLRRLVRDRPRDRDQHRAIFEAVRDQDPTTAEELTGQHLRELRDSTAALLG
ncbi:FadR/GntR family transcriptional regulator [Streptomyces sp. NPDC056149]|uniref:FadR/GntR family transcriptional regulator n=1 Tax=unclassified Streptomyces TaxID=2593676 RepID=UPI002380DE5F|nr:FCD domain-containing protein [Streptomyces sp. WZ-12]